MLYFISPPTRAELQMNVVGGSTTQKQTGDEIFLFFCSFFLKKTLCFIIYCHFITWICSMLSDVFVPSCLMYWWSVSPDSMLLNPTKKKNAWPSWQEKSLLVCLRSSLSASHSHFTYPLFSRRSFDHLSIEAPPGSIPCFFHFLSVLLVQRLLL